jgi:hypothetical protein
MSFEPLGGESCFVMRKQPVSRISSDLRRFGGIGIQAEVMPLAVGFHVCHKFPRPFVPTDTPETGRVESACGLRYFSAMMEHCHA